MKAMPSPGWPNPKARKSVQSACTLTANPPFSAKSPSPVSHPTIIFDGVCHLCNQSVDFVIRRDKQRRFRYTANQMEAGRRILQQHGKDPDEVHSVYLFEDGTLYDKSTAALRIARGLGFPWSLAYVFIIVPPFLRNAIYDWIARNRYRWFGKKDSCRLPSPDERALFLDQ